MKKSYLLLLILLTATSLFAQTTAEEFFKLGGQQFDQKNYDAAIISFSECVKLNAVSSGCYHNRALAYATKAAVERRMPDEVVKADGVNLINQSRLKGLADANKVIELNPKSANGYYLRANLFAAEKIYDKAIADYRQALAVEPNLATTKSAVFKAITDGLSVAEKGLPFSITVKGRRIALRADNLRREKHAAAAIPLYRQAIELFTASIALDKNDTNAYNDRARAYKILESYDASIADYTEVIRISEADKKLAGNYLGIYLYALNDRARVYALQKKNALAFADYAKVLAFLPSEQSNYPLQAARVDRGKLYLDTGKLNEAITDFDFILAQTPKYAKVLYYRGLAYLKKGDKTKAAADIKAAAVLDPKDAEIKGELVKLGISTATKFINSVPKSSPLQNITVSSNTENESFTTAR